MTDHFISINTKHTIFFTPKLASGRSPEFEVSGLQVSSEYLN